MKIAIMGIRGIPANYGGFETFAEELAPRLVDRGHSVTVYGRSNIIRYNDRYYKGVKIVILPTISHKYLDTVIHTFFSVIHGIFCKYDVVLMCNAANSIFTFLPKIFGQKVVLNVDGIERKRTKWNIFGKMWYLLGEILATFMPDTIVSDAGVIESYYMARYGKRSTFIPYGTNTVRLESRDILDKYGLITDEYFLFVSRLEPENNAHIVVEAYKKVKTSKKLVIVGDAPYSTEYIIHVKNLAKEDPRVIFTGYVYGEGYKQLQSNCYSFIQGTEVGGTHPALIEAMGFGNCVIVNGTEENKEVVADAALIYEKNDINDLAGKISSVLLNDVMRKEFQHKAKQRVLENYSWKVITDKYETLFNEVLKRVK